MRDSRRPPHSVRQQSTLLLTVTFAVLLVTASVGVTSAAPLAAPPNSSTMALSDDGTTRFATASESGDTVNATVDPTSVVVDVGETVVVSGDTTASTLRLYLIDPRGTFRDVDGTADSMSSIAVSGGTFEVEYDAFTGRGTYTLLVVSPWQDGEFVTTETLGRDELPPDKSHRQAVDTARTAYSGDEVLEFTVTSMTPSFTLDEFNTTLSQGTTLTVSGTSNRADGTTVTVDLTNDTDLLVSSTTTTVDGETDRWKTSIGTADLPPGEYTVFATTNETSKQARFTLTADAETTPAETPFPDETQETVNGTATPTATPTPTAVPSPTETAPGNETAGASEETDESLPGFGVGAALFALALAVVVARRRGG